jgi:hypothetical protein
LVPRDWKKGLFGSFSGPPFATIVSENPSRSRLQREEAEEADGAAD